MQRATQLAIILCGVFLASSVSAACRTVSVWDSRTGQYHWEQRCTNDPAPREVRRKKCRNVNVWDSKTGQYHWEQRCSQ